MTDIFVFVLSKPVVKYYF